MPGVTPASPTRDEQSLLVRKLPSAAEAPSLAAYAAALPADRHPVLLDSGPVQRATDLASWHLLAFDPVRIVSRRVDQPLAFAAVEAALDEVWPDRATWPATGDVHADSDQAATGNADLDLPPFRGGAIGWWGYDLGKQLERLGSRARPDIDVPDLLVGIHGFVVAEQVDTGRRLIVGRGSGAEAEHLRAALAQLEPEARAADERLALVGARLDAADAQLDLGNARLDLANARGDAATAAAPVGRLSGPARASLDRAQYEAGVAAVRRRILDGDVYQINLSQRFEVPWSGCPVALQAALRRRFPAPFGAVLRSPGAALVSSSPELFLRRRGTRIESRPIKGTRPRGATPEEDRRLREALEHSAKERAELSMIVDLVRNDLGRTAIPGTVTVHGDLRTETYATVFHRVAEISSRVPPGTRNDAIIAAAFPPGSVTGTPKIRALELIDELEPVRRHLYTGAVGWVGADGDMDLSVAIRVATLQPGRLLMNVGGGITLASDASDEYEETLHKARALFDVLGLDAHGELP